MLLPVCLTFEKPTAFVVIIDTVYTESHLTRVSCGIHN